MTEPVKSCWRAVNMQQTRNLGQSWQQTMAREDHGRLAGLRQLSRLEKGLQIAAGARGG